MANFMIPDLNLNVRDNTCCSNNRSTRIVFDEDSNRFQQKKITYACCICGGKQEIADENKRTWEVFDQSLKQKYGVSIQQARTGASIRGDYSRDCERTMSAQNFDEMLEWARGDYLLRQASERELRIPESSELGAPQMLIVAPRNQARRDLVVMISERPIEEFDPERIFECVRESKRHRNLDEIETHEIVKRVLAEIHKGGNMDITKSEIGQLVERSTTQLTSPSISEII